jgi:O-methyltransferase
MERTVDVVLQIAPDLQRVQPLTMVPETGLRDLADQVKFVLANGVPGVFVECGVWLGGAAFLVADLLRQAGARDRKVWLFDSFEGLPTPEVIDGPRALAFARNTGSPRYFDNCRASLGEVRRNAERLEVAEYTEFVKGWFTDTLPAHRARVGPIAILRIDADWYASVRCCLAELYDQVVEGGLVVVDDYYTYDGCARAVHEFLGSRGLDHQLEGTARNAGAGVVFRKGRSPWSWVRPGLRAAEDVVAIVPSGSSVIVVDDAQAEGELTPGRRAIPFLERDGFYWGAPADDATAISELERLRRAGAAFLLVAWPSIWWLDHYAEFHCYVRSRFRCLIENERIVLFELGAESRHAESS